MGLFLSWAVRRRQPRRVDLEDLLESMPNDDLAAVTEGE